MKSPCGSCKGLKFDSQHPRVTVHSLLTLGDLAPSAAPIGTCTRIHIPYTCTHILKNKINPFHLYQIVSVINATPMS